MQLAGKLFGATTAVVFGSLVFLAPGLVTSDRLAMGSLPVDAAEAEPKQKPNEHLTKLRAANYAYLAAEMAVRTEGETPANLASLKAADDAYFDAAIALETAQSNTRQLANIEAADDAWFAAAMAVELSGATPARLARLEAADDDYFEAAMALENTGIMIQQLAELKDAEARRPATMIASNEHVDPATDAAHEIVTGSIPRNDGMITSSLPKKDGEDAGKAALNKQLARLKKADDAYFEAVLSLEEKGENARDLARLKKADDAYFEAVMTIEAIESEMNRDKVKLASMAAAAPVAAAASQAASRPAVQKASGKRHHKPAYMPKPKVAGYKAVHHDRKGRRHHRHEARRKGPVRWFLGGLFRGLKSLRRELHATYK